ncbi:transglutaminase domain-containing protein [Clostridium chromiireducens]|uniref:transglutaminase domain-containing protein n=1 Tax=Clostridium chromiireducens TaxID=225345 RepID=UPI003AF5F819
MKKSRLVKLTIVSLVVTSVMALNPVGANAEWKKDNHGWWYKSGSSYYTGWKLIDKNWYYFYSNGYMAHDTTIDGYYLNSSGAWTNSVQSSYASDLDSLGQAILSNIRLENASFSIKYNGDINNVGNAIQSEIDKLKYTNPLEAYNVSDYYIQMTSRWGSSDVNVKINCTYKMSAEMASELDSRVKKIVADIAPNSMNQFEKELAIHDWIIKNTQYDQSYTIYDPYNTLIKHSGVCEGYTLLAQKMFTAAGIKSILIEGTADGQSHAWNMVYINGQWHHVDLTWDDPISSRDILRYDYFNLTDNQISKDHSWDTSKYPSAK